MLSHSTCLPAITQSALRSTHIRLRSRNKILQKSLSDTKTSGMHWRFLLLAGLTLYFFSHRDAVEIVEGPRNFTRTCHGDCVAKSYRAAATVRPTCLFLCKDAFKGLTPEQCRGARGEASPPARCKASGSRCSEDSARGRAHPRRK